MRVHMLSRETAKKIGVSPTYLSKIERGDFDPPAEDKVRRIAEIIGRDADELLALARRVSAAASTSVGLAPCAAICKSRISSKIRLKAGSGTRHTVL
jgi:transcriptional regulator with XRE-family HTH domain